MPFDAPRLGGYQIVNPPEDMRITPEVVQSISELADGSTRQRIIGYKIRATLTWDSNWIRSQDLTGLMAVANDASASITFLPRPVAYPTRSYAVVWLNKFDVSYWNGKYDVYRSTIELVTPTTTATITDLP